MSLRRRLTYAVRADAPLGGAAPRGGQARSTDAALDELARDVDSSVSSRISGRRFAAKKDRSRTVLLKGV